MVMYEFWEPASEMPMKLEEVFFFFFLKLTLDIDRMLKKENDWKCKEWFITLDHRCEPCAVHNIKCQKENTLSKSKNTETIRICQNNACYTV